ncbi:hypothetical protein AVEN_170840-1 [Araneus ventricosus]|uniref:Uncharacterized protein n=1 Tax=Araneus ventricosus TaxID=182803 RepID=A0A4Y2HTI6_ARAVE|nr:hypothetical protein AVEN_170840-1 [Araneus ventricosus]
MHGESSLESGFEPGTFRPHSRDLTTRPEARNLWYAYPWGHAKEQLGVLELKVGLKAQNSLTVKVKGLKPNRHIECLLNAPLTPRPKNLHLTPTYLWSGPSR